MSDALSTIEQVQSRAIADLSAVSTAEALEQFRIKYLGSNGEVKGLAVLIKSAPPDQKKAVGQRVNTVMGEVTAAYEARKAAIAQLASAGRDAIDVTEPGARPSVGHRHILMKVVDELVELFGRMGFATASGPEVEDEFHNFIALNIPPQHPARDPLDNFYLADARQPASGSHASSLLLRTQTSTVQIRVMEKQKPPIRVVIPGRVYRPDTTDATHLPMFHQLEALVVDRDVSMVDLKSTIMQFVRGYFGPETKVRFRPSFFPFTEPSAEVDVWFDDKQRWIELGGCGMVHPNVLKVLEKQGLNPDDYTGWAFGFGIERIAMRKYAIDDIRHLVENDLRFLKQF